MLTVTLENNPVDISVAVLRPCHSLYGQNWTFNLVEVHV